MDFTNIILILGVILATATHRVASKVYTKRIQRGAFTFSVLNIGGAIIVYALFGGVGFDFPPRLWLYAVVFSVFYLAAAVCILLAIMEGSLALTSLIVAYSPVIPTVYGLLFLHEKASVTLFIGILFLAISLVLINPKKDAGEVKITFKWVIFVVLGLIGDGAKSTMLKTQQLDFGGLYKNEFLVISFAISAVVCLVIALTREKGHMKTNLRGGGVLGIVCGLLTGSINLCTSLLAAPSRNMPASIMFPLISAGGIICSLLVACFIFKEKLSKQQLLGLALGIVSIVFLGM